MKKMIALLLAACLMAAGLNVCAAEDADNDIYLGFDSYCAYVDSMLTLTESDGEGGTVDFQTGSIDLIALEGQRIGEVLSESGYLSIEPTLEGDVFEGWMEYRINITVDEDGFETYEYERLSEDALYTTQEVLSAVMPGESVVYVAKWESIPAEEYFAETSAWEDAVSTGSFSLSANGGMITFQDTETYEADSYTYWLEDGQTLRELIESSDGAWAEVLAIEKEGATFTGWTVYEADSIFWSEESTDEEGMTSILYYTWEDTDMYIILAGSALYSESATTEELLDIACTQKSYCAVANWE